MKLSNESIMKNYYSIIIIIILYYYNEILIL